MSALREIKEEDYYVGTIAVCNVPESSLARECDSTLITHAGPEIGVASTKAFTTQLVSLLIMTLKLAVLKKGESQLISTIFADLKLLPGKIDSILSLDGQISQSAEKFLNDDHALFLGRGTMYPTAMEGALKLKEISYIHAEAYPAGELKHGPLALIDEKMPVVVVAPNNRIVDKLRSNLEEVKARGGKLIAIVTEGDTEVKSIADYCIEIPKCFREITPLLTIIPLQLLSYHIALMLSLIHI